MRRSRGFKPRGGFFGARFGGGDESPAPVIGIRLPFDHARLFESIQHGGRGARGETCVPGKFGWGGGAFEEEEAQTFRIGDVDACPFTDGVAEECEVHAIISHCGEGALFQFGFGVGHSDTLDIILIVKYLNYITKFVLTQGFKTTLKQGDYDESKESCREDQCMVG